MKIFPLNTTSHSQTFVSHPGRAGGLPVELAETLGISHDYFGKVFKEYTGKTINDYINDLRIQKAEKMLIKTEKSVINIAFSVGYENLSTFYRIFQKIKGISPMTFREKYQNKNK